MNYDKLLDFRNKFAASTTTFRFNQFVAETEIKGNKLCSTVCCAAGDIPNLYPDEVSLLIDIDFVPMYKGKTYYAWFDFLANFFEATNDEGFTIINKIFYGCYDAYNKEASNVTKADVVELLDRIIAAKGAINV